MSAAHETPGGGHSSPREASTAFWLLATTLAAAVAGWLLAHGPDALRRAVLTPVVVGIGLGLVSWRLASVGSARVPRGAWLVTALLAAGSITVLHVEFLRRLRTTADERARSDPEQAQKLAWSRQLLDAADVEPTRRERRLAAAPAWADYVAHRAVPLIGETDPPYPTLLLAGELLLAASAAGMVFRRLQPP